MDFKKTIKNILWIIPICIVFCILLLRDVPSTFRLGQSPYYLIGGNFKIYVGYRTLLDGDIFYGLYTPGVDTVISGVAWTDDKIYISLSEGNRLACIMIIDDIHDFEFPKNCCRPRFTSDSTILNNPNIIKRHAIRQNGVGWFGRFTTKMYRK